MAAAAVTPTAPALGTRASCHHPRPPSTPPYDPQSGLTAQRRPAAPRAAGRPAEPGCRAPQPHRPQDPHARPRPLTIPVGPTRPPGAPCALRHPKTQRATPNRAFPTRIRSTPQEGPKPSSEALRAPPPPRAVKAAKVLQTSVERIEPFRAQEGSSRRSDNSRAVAALPSSDRSLATRPIQLSIRYGDFPCSRPPAIASPSTLRTIPRQHHGLDPSASDTRTSPR